MLPKVCIKLCAPFGVMCSSHIYTCLRVTSYNLFQKAVLPGLTLPWKNYEPGSPTNLLPCKNSFLAQVEESTAGKAGRKDGAAAQESWEHLGQSCREASKRLCVKFQLMLPGPSLLSPLQDRTPQHSFLLHPPALAIPERCLLLQLLGSLQCTAEQRNSSYW